MSIHLFYQSNAAPSVASPLPAVASPGENVALTEPAAGVAASTGENIVAAATKPAAAGAADVVAAAAPAVQTVVGGADADDADANASQEAGAAPVGVLDNAVTPGATSLQPANAATGLDTPDSTRGQLKRRADHSVHDPSSDEESVDVDTIFDHRELDPYRVAHAFLTLENCPFPKPPGEDLTNASHELVNSGQLCFVQIHNFVESTRDCHVLFAAVNADMRWMEFLYEATDKCADMGWFGQDPPEPKELMDAATVNHVFFSIKSLIPSHS